MIFFPSRRRGEGKQQRMSQFTVLLPFANDDDKVLELHCIYVCWSSTCENKWPQKSAESHINVNAGLFGSSITGLLKQVLLLHTCFVHGMDLQYNVLSALRTQQRGLQVTTQRQFITQETWCFKKKWFRDVQKPYCDLGGRVVYFCDLLKLHALKSDIGFVHLLQRYK